MSFTSERNEVDFNPCCGKMSLLKAAKLIGVLSTANFTILEFAGMIAIAAGQQSVVSMVLTMCWLVQMAVGGLLVIGVYQRVLCLVLAWAPANALLHVTQVTIQWLLVQGVIEADIWVVDMWSPEAVTPALAIIHTLLTLLLFYGSIVVSLFAKALYQSTKPEAAAPANLGTVESSSSSESTISEESSFQ